MTLKEFKTGGVTIIDSAGDASQFLTFSSQCDYPIYYMGAKHDTIKIGNKYRHGINEIKNDFSIPQSSTYSAQTLKIFVDTSVKTNSPTTNFANDTQTTAGSVADFHSFLLLINNISDSSIYLGHTFSLFAISREAKDKNGNWVQVEKTVREVELCGTCGPFVRLQPGELIISKVKRYKGTVVTDFRLKFGYDNNIVYSNTFTDSVDERIFEHPVR